MNKEKINDAAIEYAVNIKLSTCSSYTTKTIVNAFEEGAKFASENQWQSVENELPPEDDDVFIALVNGDFTFYGVGWCSYEANGTKRWRTNDDNLDLSLIKYWMPIPKI